MLVIVIDAFDDKAIQHEKFKAVEEVLFEIGAHEIPRLLISNKIDKTELLPRIEYDDQQRPRQVWLSAHTGEGISLLKQAFAKLHIDNPVEKRLKLQPAESALRARLYQEGVVVSEATDGDGICYIMVRGEGHLIDLSLIHI